MARPADPLGDLQPMLDALASPIRREILWLVWDRELPAGDIASAFEVTAPTISSHLATLRSAGLVDMRVDGNFRRYRARRDAVRKLGTVLPSSPTKWMPADDLPEAEAVTTETVQAVVASVDVEVDVATAFRGFIDQTLYSRWLGVPVTIDDGRFACTMEWGTRVRGTYEVIHPNELLALRWDFDDDVAPVPGTTVVAYQRFRARRQGTRVEVHQLAADEEQAIFLTSAWGMVLGRFRAGIAAAVASDRPGGTARKPRPKRRNR